MEQELALELENQMPEIERASREIEGFLEPMGFSERTANAVLMLIEEILSNIIKHAWDDGAAHTIGLVAEVQEDEVALTFSDTGKPFNPLAVNAPGMNRPLAERLEKGLGIFFTKRMMNDMEYRREEGRNLLTVRVYA